MARYKVTRVRTLRDGVTGYSLAVSYGPDTHVNEVIEVPPEALSHELYIRNKLREWQAERLAMKVGPIAKKERREDYAKADKSDEIDADS